jgi:predicted permease
MIPFLRRLYRVLLLGCPPAIRREYGAEMEALFGQCIATEWRRRGLFGRVVACARGFADLGTFAIRAHWRQLRPGRQQPCTESRRRPPVIMRDIRGAVRTFKTQPALSAAVIAMLALGIGATTAIFSVVYGVLLRPLPFPDPDELVQIYGTRLDRGWATLSLTEANFWDLRDRNRSFDEFGAFHGTSFSLTGTEIPERVTGARVSVGFFRALGVRPVVGRLFEPGEDEPGPDRNLVLLSNGLWSRRFGADSGIAGRHVTLDGRPYTVVGVLPAGSPWLNAVDVFVPFVRRADADRGSFEYVAIGRLKDGVTADRALADLETIAKQLEAAHPATNTNLGITLQESRTWIASDNLRRTLWILLGAVTLLLLIACVNVTNLLLARGSARARDSAVRSALGASRVDIVRERLTESLFYSVAGTLAGFALARGMLSVLQSANPDGIPRLAEVGLDPWVLAFAAAVALAVGIITGLVPALSVPFGNIVSALRPSQRGTSGGHGRTRAIFVAAQVALSVTLLIGAALLVKSLLNVLSLERGFNTENRMLLTVSIPRSFGPERMVQTGDEILARLATLPDVVSVAAVSGRPLTRGSTGMGIAAADVPDSPGAAVPWATWRIVTRDYFKVMGLPVIAGRVFTERDQFGKPAQVVISKRVADLLWPAQDPIGRTAILWKGQSNMPAQVIGVVGNMRERGLEADPTLAVYFPAAGSAFASLQIAIHTKGQPKDAMAAIRTVVAGVDRNLPISNVTTMEDLVSASVSTRRMTMMLLATFAGLALVLALAGVYGVLTYSVARRTAEMGVRLALGADHRRLLYLVVAQGMRPVMVGAALGLAATYWVAQLMVTLLFGITARDSATYGAVTAVVVAIALLACYLPARRVLRVDPVVALRVE